MITELLELLDFDHWWSGNAALEKLLENYAGKYATGDEPFLVCYFSDPHIRMVLSTKFSNLSLNWNHNLQVIRSA